MKESTTKEHHLYADGNVRARVLDFLGANLCGNLECHHLVKGDKEGLHLHEPHSPEELYSLFEENVEIFRSLWDRSALITDLDVEYVNFDDPTKTYTEPERVFELLAPVERVIIDLLSQYGIAPLHLFTGRGHHFIWQIPQHSVAFKHLAALGRGPQSLWRINAKAHAPDGKSISPELGRAFAGLGLIMEFLAHRIQELAAPRCTIPVELTAIEVGPRNFNRDMVSIDISEYGDPLHSRTVRAPFSCYFKPWQQSDKGSSGIEGGFPSLFSIPVNGEGTPPSVMRDPEKVARLAHAATTKIPDGAAGMEKLLTDYMESKLAKFHDWFYSKEQEPPEQWSESYERVPLELLTKCTRLILEQPNDLLLRPSCIRRVVRSMLALGWHPRDIAGLICSKYEGEFGWTQFVDIDPATRADFYTRIFAGLFVTGRDDLVDFNCCSAHEQGLCFFSNCNDNLLRFKESALNRRTHDKLADRPFNRLLLPTELV